MFGCKHKWGKVEEGYQYCEKCGKARAAPEKICSHHWVEMDSYKLSNIFSRDRDSFNSVTYIMRCSGCGEMKNYSTQD